jgi:hypothetical protein
MATSSDINKNNSNSNFIEELLEKAREEAEAEHQERLFKMEGGGNPPLTSEQKDAATAQNSKKVVLLLTFLSTTFQSIYNAFKMSSSVASITTILSLCIVIFSMILALRYLMKLLQQLADEELIANPLNKEAIDYSISKSIRFFGSEYKYQLFLILPALSLIFAIIAVIKPATGLVKGIAFACLFQSLIALIVNISTYNYAYKTIYLVNERIKNMNNFIHNKFYKNAKFLNSLKNIPSNSLLVLNVVKGAVSNIEKDVSIDNLSQAFFTLNLYFHIQKIGHRNINIKDAVEMFDIHNILAGSSLKDKVNIVSKIAKLSWSPTDFFFRKTTFVEDYSNSIKQMYISVGGSNKLANKAMIRVSAWIEELNNRANTITPEDSMGRFFPMAITILVMQTLPLLLLIFIFQKESVRNGISQFLNLRSGS